MTPKPWLRDYLKILLAFSAGCATAFSFPPWHFLITLLPGYCILAFLFVREPKKGKTFLFGWAFGTGFFLISLHWIGHAFMVDADRFAFLMPIAIILLAIGLGLFYGMATLLSTIASFGWRRILAFAAAIGLCEWFRGWILTGFPWHTPAYVWVASDELLQITSLIGITGLTPLTVLSASFPILVFELNRKSNRLASVLLLVCVFVASSCWLWGNHRLTTQSIEYHPDLLLRLVQGGIAQADKWNPKLIDQNLSIYTELSRSASPGTHIIWPETATPFFVAEDSVRRAKMANILPTTKNFIISGTPRRSNGPSGPVYYNSVIAIDKNAHIVAKYDKIHLVPFGEYLPFRKFLKYTGLEKLAIGPTDYSVGDGPTMIRLPGLPPARILICYEILFPSEIASYDRPAWLLNLSNDAWFGEKVGPYQHFEIARVRAVEFGLPVVRATNTGISAFINPLGQI